MQHMVAASTCERPQQGAVRAQLSTGVINLDLAAETSQRGAGRLHFLLKLSPSLSLVLTAPYQHFERAAHVQNALAGSGPSDMDQGLCRRAPRNASLTFRCSHGTRPAPRAELQPDPHSLLRIRPYPPPDQGR